MSDMKLEHKSLINLLTEEGKLKKEWYLFMEKRIHHISKSNIGASKSNDTGIPLMST